MKNKILLLAFAVFVGAILLSGCQKQKSCESVFSNDGRIIRGYLQKLDEPYKTDETFVMKNYKITAHFMDVDGNVFYIAGKVPKGIASNTTVRVILAEVGDYDNLYHTKKMIYTLSCLSEDY
ncbi:MAG: hypothetical protein IKO34_08060 [Bacteroidales bacterium]|nr:hypothetical protein [Bacteroidales bacterium]